MTTNNIDEKLVDIMCEVTYDGGSTPDGIDEAKESIKSLLREEYQIGYNSGFHDSQLLVEESNREARKDEINKLITEYRAIPFGEVLSIGNLVEDRIKELDNLLGSK